MCIKLLASLCQKLQLDENISKEKQMTLQGHYCSLITLGFVCVSPPTRVSLLLCVWVCARVCVREVIMQMMVDVLVRHNVDTNTPLATCACVFTHAHISSLWMTRGLQLHNSLSSGKTGSEDGWQKAQQWLSLWPFLLHFICLRGRPRTQGIKILKYWMKEKDAVKLFI